MQDTFGTSGILDVGGTKHRIWRLEALEKRGWGMVRLPYALRILLENLLRCEDGAVVTAEEIEAVARWDPKAPSTREIAFTPARVLILDFTCVPSVVDLASMRDWIKRMGGDPK